MTLTGYTEKLVVDFFSWSIFRNGLNQLSHTLLITGLTGRFVPLPNLHSNTTVFLSIVLQGFGYRGSLGSKSEQALKEEFD